MRFDIIALVTDKQRVWVRFHSVNTGETCSTRSHITCTLTLHVSLQIFTILCMRKSCKQIKRLMQDPQEVLTSKCSLSESLSGAHSLISPAGCEWRQKARVSSLPITWFIIESIQMGSSCFSDCLKNLSPRYEDYLTRSELGLWFKKHSLFFSLAFKNCQLHLLLCSEKQKTQ